MTQAVGAGANWRRLPGSPGDWRRRIAPWVLVLFAFSAWSLTSVANRALGVLVLLFLMELPAHWPRLVRDPAVLLLVGALALGGLLALHGTAILPGTAARQWDGVIAWCAPLLFVVVAWWSRGDEGLIRAVLAAGALGLAVGVLRKSDWSLINQILAGMRYHFGYAALGLRFLASVMLAGLILLRGRIVSLTLAGRSRCSAGSSGRWDWPSVWGCWW